MVAGPAVRHAACMDENATTTQTPAPDGGEPRRLYRSATDRVLGGVCGGIAAYFGIDPVIVRVVAVALVAVGGVGALLYVAALLLVPVEGGVAPVARGRRERMLTLIGIGVLVIAVGAIVPWHGGFFGGLIGLVLVVLLIALAAGWIGPGPAAGDGAALARRLLLVLALLVVCGLIAVGGAWAAAAGGRTAVAIAVIGAGVLLVAGASTRRARWLILPALALALPAGVVSAAGISSTGGVGDRDYVPTAADLRPSYELGAGQLIVDLRKVRFAPGDHPLKLRVGVGRALLLVPRNVCVASRARVGIGGAELFTQRNGGVDVDWHQQSVAQPGRARLVVDARVGIGAFEVHYKRPANGAWWHQQAADGAGNAACA
jgi:phage shock protein PspC (stress-responsive transcriptional regulator)